MNIPAGTSKQRKQKWLGGVDSYRAGAAKFAVIKKRGQKNWTLSILKRSTNRCFKLFENAFGGKLGGNF